MNKKLVLLTAAAAACAALLCACQVRTPRPMASPARSAAPARSATPSSATATPKKAVPSAPAGKTASQDTAGARTTLPEEAGIR